MSRWVITFEVEVDAETEESAVLKAKRQIGNDRHEPTEIEEVE
jgi:hypothetical protein